MPLADLVRTIDLPLVLLLGYLGALWLGGWALERMARAHFRKAQAHGHRSFEFDPILDRYECPGGSHLILHDKDLRNRLAIYKAPAESCAACSLRGFCRPEDDGRRVLRSLAEFHETDIGWFHRRLSLVILSIAAIFAWGGVLAWWGRPGEPTLLVAALMSLVFLMHEVRGAWASGKGETDPAADPNDWNGQSLGLPSG